MRFIGLCLLAAISLLMSQLVLASGGEIFSGLAYINPADLTDVKKAVFTINGTFLNRNSTFTGSVIGTSGVVKNQLPNIFLPDFMLALRLSKYVVLGIRRSNAYNVVASYPSTSFARFGAVTTNTEAINDTVDFGVQLSKRLSVGAGVDWQHFSLFISEVAPPPGPLETPVAIRGDSYGVGWHAGLTFDITPITFLNVIYYSKIMHNLVGTETINSPIAGQLIVPSTAAASLPAITEINIVQVLSHHLLIQAQAIYTQWSILKSIILKSTAFTDPIIFNYRNTWYGLLGMRYIINKKWYLQSAVTFDETPSNFRDRSLRAPGGDVFGIALGAHFQLPAFGIGVDYGHGFVGKLNIQNRTKPTVPILGIANVNGNAVAVKITFGT